MICGGGETVGIAADLTAHSCTGSGAMLCKGGLSDGVWMMDGAKRSERGCILHWPRDVAIIKFSFNVLMESRCLPQHVEMTTAFLKLASLDDLKKFSRFSWLRYQMKVLS